MHIKSSVNLPLPQESQQTVGVWNMFPVPVEPIPAALMPFEIKDENVQR